MCHVGQTVVSFFQILSLPTPQRRLSYVVQTHRLNLENRISVLLTAAATGYVWQGDYATTHHPARAVDLSNDKASRRQNHKQGNARRWGQPTTGIVGKLDREPTSILAALASVTRAARLSTAWVCASNRRTLIARALGERVEGLGNPVNRTSATAVLLSCGGMYLTRTVRRALGDAGWE